ncbi:MAG: AAA family ATPase, partial [Desulfobacterales bacterium]|nr:AAA family ATPase [Desulfobacterales bacterium]
MLELPGHHVAEKIYESASIVYRGRRERDGRPVIFKSLSSDHPTIGNIARLNHEAEILKNLNIEGVPRLFGKAQDKNKPVLIMEDVGRLTLQGYCESTRIEPGLFLELAVQLVELIGKVHQENIIHKDINPANLIFDPEKNRVMLIDFGIASLLSRENPTFSAPELIEGTLAYISPEQTGRMNRSIDYRTDFYSLGVVFYRILCGRLPFETADPMEMIHCHIARSAPPVREIAPDIPEVVENIVMKLLSKTAEERYQSAYGLKRDLERCLEAWRDKGRIEPFPIAKEDISEQFQIPQRLYGREKDIEALLNAFSQAKNGKTELILIAGHSGIGKTVLVNEIHKPVVQSRGRFTSGKFNQFEKETPFSALIQAFQELIRQLLTESRKNLERWREKILHALTPNARLITEVIPDLELIIGEQPETPTLAPAESRNRFNTYFKKFFNIFTSKEHPLVIFLDDLQWADNATLDMITRILGDLESNHLLLIGAYRDNEVTPAHPLALTLDAIEKQDVAVETIGLKTLSA